MNLPVSLHVAVIGMLFCIGQSQAAPYFWDATSEAGLWYLENPERLEPAKMQHRMSGGVASRDYDGDGWVDLYVTRFGAADILFRNNGDGTFENVTEAAFAGTTMSMQSNGAGWGDIDNDGDPDLYVTASEEGRFYLYNNNGDGTFSELADERGAAIRSDEPHYGFSVAFGDYDRDGFLDLVTSEWRTLWQTDENGPTHTRLLRNRGAERPGHFDDVTDSAGVSVDDLHPHGDFALSPRFSDLDGDGWSDLVIASDFLTSRIFWNDGDGTFTDGTIAARVGTDRSGMGSTVGDYDGDGDLDWFVTAIDDPRSVYETGNRLYRNEGNREFSDATDEAGVRRGNWGWGTSFLDYDNDSDLDLIMTNGMSGELGERSAGYLDDPMHLWRNDDGVFSEVSADAGVIDTRQGRGLIVFDYDKDGDQDVFIANNADGPLLLRNDGGDDNDWLRVVARGTQSNSDGIGARVTLTPDLSKPEEIFLREIDGGSNYLGQSEPVAHFGLGAGSEKMTVDLVTIQWPNGGIEQFANIRKNSTFIAVESVPEPGGGWLVHLTILVALSLRRRLRA